MCRLAGLIIGAFLLSGCCELQVIGQATMRELSIDQVVSVERVRYTPRPVKVKTASLVAKAERKELWRKF